MTSRLLAHGDLHEQIQEVTKRIKADPKNAGLYHKRGELHRAHGEYSEALKDYDEAEKLDPALDVVFFSRGRTLFESGKSAEALEAVNLFLSRQARHPEARWLRAQALAKLNRRTDAEKDFREVIESAPELSPDQYIERAKNLEQAGRVEQALVVIQGGVQRLGPLITLELAALDFELALKKYEAAHQRIDRLVEHAERKETYLIRKAEVFALMGDKLQAQQCYAKALNAIAALPERQRRIKSTAQMEKDVRRKLSLAESKQQ